jgi:hypothetical protein
MPKVLDASGRYPRENTGQFRRDTGHAAGGVAAAAYRGAST